MKPPIHAQAAPGADARPDSDSARKKLQAMIARVEEHATVPPEARPASAARASSLPWRAALVLVLVLSCLAFAAWYSRPRATGAAPVQAARPSQAVAASGAPEPAGEMHISGHFIARRLSRLTSNVVARVARIAVHEGQHVRAGEQLLLLDVAGGDAERAAAQAKLDGQVLQINTERLAMQQASSEFRQQEDLRQQGFVSTQSLARTRLAMEQAKLRLEIAQAQQRELHNYLLGIDQRQRQLSLRAPFAGKVIAIAATEGEVVSPGNYDERFVQSGLLTLVDPHSLRVELAVQESLYAKVQQAGCALVSAVAQPDKIKLRPFVIDEVAQTADRQRGTLTVYLASKRETSEWPILNGEASVLFVGPNDARCEPDAKQH
ncbi:hypothetical protein RugamoR64_55720 [Duganella rhizosphaerae]|uniref:efflux RND transporter periplasmic adaptor subunit n=1 Tax=Duganella rhizosphaerae TaxID=2885763 RepID=UPI0030EA28D6